MIDEQACCARCYPPLYEPVPLSEHQLDAVTDTAAHLFAHGLPPIFPLSVCRAIWKRGDRALAEALARLRGSYE